MADKMLWDFSVLDAFGQAHPLSSYKGQPILIVNTASKCGFTPQYAGIEKLWQRYRGDGLQVLGFPCNQFGGQEPGSALEIADFCSLNFGVSFPVFAKIEVNGPQADPLYTWLKSKAPGLFGSQRIKWNFTKFLVERSGQEVRRFAPTTKPDALVEAIEKALR